MTVLSTLERLHMKGCSSISKLPTGIGLMKSLTSLSMDLAFESQALGIGQLNVLKHLSVWQCTDEVISAVDSSDTLKNLDKLVQFRFSNCKLLTKLPDTIWQLTSLEELHLYDCEKLQELPNSIGQLKALKILDLIKLSSLQTLPSSLGALTSLRSLIISQCTSITMLPMSIGNLSNLHELTIEGSGELQSLPDSIRQLNELRILQILDCGSLESLGALRVLQGLRIWGCTSITTLLGSCLIVLDSCFWGPAWYYTKFVRRNLKELRVVEANDCGFLRLVGDTVSGRSILQRVLKSTCSTSIPI